MQITPSVHTIILLVGPTECGKSTFAKKVLIPGLMHEDTSKNFRMNVQYISSDDIRRDLLGYDYDKHDSIMTEASIQAFNLLEKRIEAVTSFPINAEFVVVDTKGLSEEFRDGICKIAERNHYNIEAIVFDYKNSQDYYLPNTKNKHIIARDVMKLKTDVIAKLKKGQFSRVYRVKAKDFLDEAGNASEAYNVQIDNLDLYLKTILPADQEYFMVGDPHEQVEALVKVFEKKGFTFENGKLIPSPKFKQKMVGILVGDIVDKGNKTEEMIRFVYENREFIKLVKGNHENFDCKFLKGELDDVNSLPADLIPTQFTSIAVLQNNEELRNMFFELVEEAMEVYRYIGIRDNSFYVTHAPCHNKFLGKIDAVSRKKQRNFRFNREENIESQLAFLNREAVGNHPYHVFGHIAASNNFRIKNKFGIDTGAVYGNKLTFVSFYGGKAFVHAVPVVNVTNKEELPILFERKRLGVNLSDLNDDDRKRLHYVLRNKINFISGTITPADKDEETGELESLAQGLAYFKNHGVSVVSMQPKYMGSRCTIYLASTPEESYAVSRNGYKIRNVDLTDVYKRLIQKHFSENPNLKMVILDGELMPWVTLGKGLIERDFKVIDVALAQEIEFLKASGFEEKLDELFNRFDQSEFAKDQGTMSKQDLIEKYGMALYGQFKHVRDVKRGYNRLSLHEEAHAVYHEQIEIYGADGEVDFKPFAILKEIDVNGNEILFDETPKSSQFAYVSDDDHLTINLNDPDYFEKTNAFYLSLTTDRKMEGVVLKPDRDVKRVAPAIKVRNPNYLRIIYGYDYTFPQKYEKLFRQKNIRKKIETSINEYELGKEMLAFNMEQIEVNNKDYQQVVANMLFETSKEAGIDPRL